MSFRSKLGLVLALLFAGSLWFYVKRVLIPYQESDAAIHGRPRGILSDLYPRWLGARELLLHHRDPYSPEVTRDIQTGYYGRPLDPKRANDPTDQEGFAYPVYVVFLLAPTIELPFPLVRTGFTWLLMAMIVWTVWAWIRFLQWRPSRPTAVAILALTLGCFPVAQGILLQQLSVLVSTLLAGCLLALLSGHLFLAGSLLAIATIKPQLVWPLAAWLVLWACREWRKRWPFQAGLGATGIVLALAGELVLPGWIGRFHEAVKAYRQYTGSESIFEKLTAPTVGTLINWAILLAIAVVCWRARKAESKSVQFAVVSSLVLAATIVVVSSVAPYNQILLLPAALIVLQDWTALRSTNLLTRVASTIGAAFVLWPWLSSMALLAASPFLLAATLQKAWWVPLFSSLAIPPSVLGLCALCTRLSAFEIEPAA